MKNRLRLRAHASSVLFLPPPAATPCRPAVSFPASRLVTFFWTICQSIRVHSYRGLVNHWNENLWTDTNVLLHVSMGFGLGFRDGPYSGVCSMLPFRVAGGSDFSLLAPVFQRRKTPEYHALDDEMSI